MKLKYALALPLAALFVLPASLSASASPIVTPTAFATVAGSDLNDIALCGGNTYTANGRANSVSSISATGSVTNVDFSTNPWPVAVACSPSGAYLYVVGWSSSRVARITTATGVVDFNFADFGSDNPYGPMITDTVGNVYVVNSVSTGDAHGPHWYLAKIAPSGAVDKRFADLGAEHGVSLAQSSSAGNRIYVTTGKDDKILKVDETSGSVSTFASVPSYGGGMVVDQDDNLMVATGDGYIAKYAPDGTLVDPAFAYIATSTSGEAPALTRDSSGNLYATDYYSRDISVITRSGVVSTLAEFRTGGKPLQSVVSSSGILYTSSNSDHTIYRIDLAAAMVAPPHLTSSTPPNKVQGHAYSFTFTATGSGVTYSIQHGSLPATFSLDPNTGVLSSPNSNGTPGTYSFDVVATNAWGSDTQHVTFQLYHNTF